MVVVGPILPCMAYLFLFQSQVAANQTTCANRSKTTQGENNSKHNTKNNSNYKIGIVRNESMYSVL